MNNMKNGRLRRALIFPFVGQAPLWKSVDSFWTSLIIQNMRNTKNAGFAVPSFFRFLQGAIVKEGLDSFWTTTIFGTVE